MLEVQVLGPLEVRVEGTPLRLGTPKQQAVFAMLAVQPNQVVGLAELVDELWPRRVPASAVANARGYAANLRRLFDAALPDRGLLSRSGSGYQLWLRPDEVDLVGFNTECHQARQAAARGDWVTAETLFARAEARWRGRMFAGVPLGSVLEGRRAATEEQRLTVVEERAALALAMGQPQEALTLLRDHVQTHPLRERAQELFVRSRYKVGDIAGAIAAYAAARSTLVDQLGIEPGVHLQRLHHAILNREPIPDLSGEGSAALRPIEVPTAPRQVPRPAQSVPTPASGGTAEPRHWLPRAIADFTGRRETVARLVAAAESAQPTATLVQVIDGMAGSGKTTLAVHVANRLAPRYPDGQLFIDLRGHSEGLPLEPANALVTLLRQLGVPAGRIPPELDHRVALWRMELAGSRVIVVLDNAASSEQIVPLLPTAPGSLVLVTSRRRLAAFDGVPPQSLQVLAEADAIDLLARVAGPQRVGAEPDPAAEVVRRCGYLPLAIRLAGARLAHRSGWRVADLARRLGQVWSILTELAAEDHSVAGAFALSYEPLPDPAKRMFRLLGLYPGEFFRSVTAAALTDLPLPKAEAIINELVDRHLVEEIDLGRFRLHDLMREYALGLSTKTDSPAARQAATKRVLDHYLQAAAAATAPLELTTHRHTLNVPDPIRPDLRAALGTVDVGWLESERANITTLVRLASQTGHFKLAWQLARATWRFYYIRGYYDDIFDTHSQGLDAARQLNDASAVATMHNYLASAYLRTGHYHDALNYLNRAIALREEDGDTVGTNVSRANLAVVCWLLGRLDEALALNQRTLEERRQSGADMAGVLPNLGMVLMMLGRYDEALRLHRLHLVASRERKDDFYLAQALGQIGSVRLRLGHLDQAVRLIKASLGHRCRTGNRFGEAEMINELGVAYRRLGRLDEAVWQHQAALGVVTVCGERHVESAALNDLGLTLAVAGRGTEAVEMHERALALATRISHPYEQGRALAGIAACCVPDDPAEARRHWERALAIFKRMGVPERREVEQQLARLAAPQEVARATAPPTR